MYSESGPDTVQRIKCVCVSAGVCVCGSLSLSVLCVFCYAIEADQMRPSLPILLFFLNGQLLKELRLAVTNIMEEKLKEPMNLLKVARASR